MFANAELARAAAEKEIEEARARTAAQRALAEAQAQAAQRTLVVAREKAGNEAKSLFMSLMMHEVLLLSLAAIPYSPELLAYQASCYWPVSGMCWHGAVMLVFLCFLHCRPIWLVSVQKLHCCPFWTALKFLPSFAHLLDRARHGNRTETFSGERCLG